MAQFQPRVFQEIMGDMIQRLISATPLTDINYGSVFTTMLEAAAQEDDEQYFQMLEIIRGYSLDTTTGDDLDTRAYEYGLERKDSQFATTSVTIGDSTITKVSTELYSGKSGPSAGSTVIAANEDIGFPTSGSIVIGRGTPNAETVGYLNITVLSNYVEFNLAASLANDHGTDETIVLSQGGNRTIPSGTVVYVPEGDITPRIDFETDAEVILLDGEDEIESVSITAAEAGYDSNVPIGSISKFDSPPFSGATVSNPARVTNGEDEETDQELRDRIKDHIQSLSRGTGRSIITNVLGVISEEENKRVVSASLVEPTIPADVVRLYIDDGTGFIPSFQNVGYEEVVSSATGGEKYLSIINVPVVKAFVETQNTEVYNLVGGEDLYVEVGGKSETILFESTDFVQPGAARAQEVLSKINENSELFESRVSDSGSKVRIFARANTGEEIRVTGGTANTALNFPTDLKYTTKLYKKRDGEVVFLSKDGKTASIESGNTEGYDFSITRSFVAVIDGKYNNPQICWFFPGDFSNPSSVTAQEVADKISLSGVETQISSGGTKVTLTSKTQRSDSSKIKILEDFNKVFNEESGVNTDRTVEAANELVTFFSFASNLDYVYIGMGNTRFFSMYFRLLAGASADISLSMESYNGTSWNEIGFFDSTNGMQQSGHIEFGRPYDWVPISVESTDAQYYVRLRRNNAAVITPPNVEAIRLSSANEILGFSNTEVVGVNQDYVLNRFVGQIELDQPLNKFDQITLGTVESKAFLTTVASGNYGLSGGEVLNILVDGVLQTYTFVAGDFFTPGDALVAEVIVAIEREFSGITASAVDLATKIQIESNTINDGTIQFEEAGANLILQFPIELKESITSHIPALESGNSQPFSFAIDDEVIVIMDGNLARNYTVSCTHDGTLTGATSNTIFSDTSLNPIFPLTDEMAGFDLEFTTGVNATVRRQIASYVPATGTITMALAFPLTPVIGDEYQIIPRLAKHLEIFWNNSQITLLSNDAEIKASSGGTKIQIASKNTGETASVRVSGGTGNIALDFTLIAKLGIDAYRYFTGLAQITQWTVDGRADDQENYPGIRAAGVQVEVIEPIKVPVSVELQVTTQEGITLTSITNDVKSAVSNYVNTLDVGADVIISEIIYAVKSVSGVFDVKVVLPLVNIAIADGELPRISEDNITVG